MHHRAGRISRKKFFSLPTVQVSIITCYEFEEVDIHTVGHDTFRFSTVH